MGPDKSKPLIMFQNTTRVAPCSQRPIWERWRDAFGSNASCHHPDVTAVGVLSQQLLLCLSVPGCKFLPFVPFGPNWIILSALSRKTF